MSPELEDQLITRYPLLFACNRDWEMHGVDEHFAVQCGDGWFGLVEATCRVLQELAMRTFDRTRGGVVWMPRARIYTDPGQRTDQGGLMRVDLFDRDHLPSPPVPGHVMTAATHVDLLARGISWMAADASSVVCEVCGNAGRHANLRVRCMDHCDVSAADVQSFANRAVDKLLMQCRPPANGKAFVTVLRTKNRQRPRA